MAKNKKEETVDYDYIEGLNTMQISRHLKKGFQYYVTHNNIKITNNTSLTKEFKKYLNKSVGA